MTTEPVYDFQSQLRLGNVGERITVAALRCLDDWQVEEQAESMREQKGLGIDYVARFRGDRGTVEIKTDMRGYRTENLALEIGHDHDDGRTTEGWADTTTAAYLLLLVIDQKGIEAFANGSEMNRSAMMFALRVRELRHDFKQWRQRFAAKSARNATYKTLVIPVPIREVRKSTALIGDYGVAYKTLHGVEVVRACVRPTNGKPFTIDMPH